MEAWKAEIKGETKSLFGTLSRNQEYVTNEHDKIRSELKHETEKLMASQRLDLNLEKGRMRDEMHTMEDRLHTAEDISNVDCRILGREPGVWICNL